MSDKNNCSHLVINYEEAKEFDEIVNMQKSLQERISPGFYNPNESLASIAEFTMKNYHASHEEEDEYLNALGGNNHGPGPGSACWKWWKAENKTTAQTMCFNDLHPDDQLEAKMELVDKFHFFMNDMIKIGMSGSELYSMYKSKNLENFRRQDGKY